MLIGSGLLAQAFAPAYADNRDIVVFASGVSNSREVRAEQFAREERMLHDALALGKQLLYFSTCSVADPELASSAYVTHKLKMERLVLQGAEGNAVFRLPQVVGHTPNPHTLTNFLYHQISTGAAFHVWKGAWRNLIDVDDVARIVEFMVNNPAAHASVATVASPFSVPMTELVRAFESVLGKKANCDFVDAGGQYCIDATLASEVAQRVGICFDDAYVLHLIKKYYG